MKITLYIRRSLADPTKVTMRTDFTHESADTPRISNFGLDIKNKLDEIIGECETTRKTNEWEKK